MQSERHLLQRANEDACTLLLGTLMMRVLSSLRQHRTQLQGLLDPDAEGGDAVDTFVAASTLVLVVLPPTQSAGGVWEALLCLGDAASATGSGGVRRQLHA